MQKISIIFLILLLVSCHNGHDSLNGKTFVGVEKISGCDDLILVQNTFSFFGDSVLLKRKYIKHSSKALMEKSFQYKGLVEKNHLEIDINAFAYRCPDCNVWNHINSKTGKLEKLTDKKTYKGFFKDGKLTLNNFVYEQ